MANLWTLVKTAWSEPEEDWRDAKPSLFGKKPEELYGKVHHVDDYFGGSPMRPTPWPQQTRSKKFQDYDKDKVREALRKPPVLEDVDPRVLRATQPSIIRAATEHYMDPKQREHGETFEAGNNVGNAHPTVYINEHTGEHKILSGHHRAAKALFAGHPLRARVIRGGTPPR